MPEFLIDIETRVREQYCVVADTEEEALATWESGDLNEHDVLEITEGPSVGLVANDD